MKHLLLVTAATLAFSPLAMAMEDDFGALFTDNAPAGLRDTSPVGDVIGKDLFDPGDIENFDPNSIEPAAGDEEAAPGEQEDVHAHDQEDAITDIEQGVKEETVPTADAP